jgi:hypothetical protein
MNTTCRLVRSLFGKRERRTTRETNPFDHFQSSEIINTKLKDIDNSPSFAPPSSINASQTARPERLYGCSVCPYESTTPSHIHRHVELHGGDDGGGFQCSQCFFLSKWRASIRKHMISAHGSSLASLTNVLEPLIVLKSDDASVIVKKWLSMLTDRPGDIRFLVTFACRCLVRTTTARHVRTRTPIEFCSNSTSFVTMYIDMTTRPCTRACFARSLPMRKMRWPTIECYT